MDFNKIFSIKKTNSFPQICSYATFPKNPCNWKQCSKSKFETQGSNKLTPTTNISNLFLRTLFISTFDDIPNFDKAKTIDLRQLQGLYQ
jgi:hypothetical protein